MVRSPPGTGSTKQQLGEHVGNPEGKVFALLMLHGAGTPSPSSQDPLSHPGHTGLITKPRLDGDWMARQQKPWEVFGLGTSCGH